MGQDQWSDVLVDSSGIDEHLVSKLGVTVRDGPFLLCEWT